MITSQYIIDQFNSSAAAKKAKAQKKALPKSGVVHLDTQWHGKKGTPVKKQVIRYANVSRDGAHYSISIEVRHISHHKKFS